MVTHTAGGKCGGGLMGSALRVCQVDPLRLQGGCGGGSPHCPAKARAQTGLWGGLAGVAKQVPCDTQGPQTQGSRAQGRWGAPGVERMVFRNGCGQHGAVGVQAGCAE